MSQHSNRIQKARERFTEWLVQRPLEEESLHLNAYAYEEEFFDDLTLENPRVRKALISYRIKGEDGQWHYNWCDLNEDLTIDGRWVFQFHNFRGPRSDFFGLCETTRYRILIKKGLSKKETKTTLLHEMIHAYDYMLESRPGFREWLMIDLYKRMVKKLGQKKVDRYLEISTHAYHGDANHTCLFLLKSLDLDRRHRWQPGTVFGYGREDLFK